ncbi:MAG: helicase HerA-like domain-containing protein, partial [bacterium]
MTARRISSADRAASVTLVIEGATGTGKTVSLMVLAEGFSR